MFWNRRYNTAVVDDGRQIFFGQRGNCRVVWFFRCLQAWGSQTARLFEQPGGLEMTEYYATLCRYKVENHTLEKIATWPIGDLSETELNFFQKKILGEHEGFQIRECGVEQLSESLFWDAIYLREVKPRSFEEQFEIKNEIDSITDTDSPFGIDIRLATPGGRVLWNCLCLADDIRRHAE